MQKKHEKNTKALSASNRNVNWNNIILFLLPRKREMSKFEISKMLLLRIILEFEVRNH